MAIHVRADAGFSPPAVYQAIEELDMGFCVGIGSNERLKRLIASQVEEVESEFVQHVMPHQHFVGIFEYQTDSWQVPQDVYAKIESTSKGLNVRFYVSNGYRMKIKTKQAFELINALSGLKHSQVLTVLKFSLHTKQWKLG